MTRNRVAALLSVVALLAAPAVFAGEKGLVSNSGGMLKAEPKPKGKKVDKLKQGIMVDVVDHSADGLWVKVVTGGDASLEGWVEKTYVRSLSRYGFTWERKSVAGGNSTSGKPPVAAETPVAAKGTTTDPVPATDEGWGKETPIEDASNAEWDKAPEPTPTPAAGATPTPAEDEGWGSEEVDVTK